MSPAGMRYGRGAPRTAGGSPTDHRLGRSQSHPFGGSRDGENAVSGHGTQKPVRLWERPILHHTTTRDTLYDPFCGSGTAVIAAEKTERTCVAMDLDPQYIHVTRTRWEAFTGQRARAPARSTAGDRRIRCVTARTRRRAHRAGPPVGGRAAPSRGA